MRAAPAIRAPRSRELDDMRPPFPVEPAPLFAPSSASASLAIISE